MSLDIAIIAVGVVLVAAISSYLLATFGGAISQNVILPLALFAGTGSLLATGTIEMAGRYGFSTLLALFAFTMVFIFSPLIFYPIRRLNEIIRFASLVDFLTFRFRGKAVATIACSCLIIATIPLFLAQLLALSSLHEFLLNDYEWLFGTILASIIVLINWRTIELGVAQTLRWIMAAAGFLLLLALTMAALVSVNSIFGGIAEMNQWVVDSGQRVIVQRMDSSYSLFIIFLAASFALPVNFSIVISEYISDHQAGISAWAYPLVMLLASIPIFPLLWSGLAVQSSSPLQDYLFAIPALTQHPVVAGLGAASIILVAIALLCNLSIMLARMVVNSLILPTKALQQQPQLNRWINRYLILISSALIIGCLLLSQIVKGRSITDLYLVGFAGLAQLTPGMLASIYLPRISRSGFIVGLLGGLSLWLVTLALPLLFGDWSWSVPGSDIELVFGMENWETWAFEALMVNMVLAILISTLTTMDTEQQSFARLCMVDNIYIPARVQLSHSSVMQMRDSLRLTLGSEADAEIELALQRLNLDYNETRPAALRKLRDNLNSSLTLRYGVLAAYRIMEESLPLLTPQNQEPDDIYQIESVLAIQGDRLTGIASELNKLRVHHREILDNLPIGIASLGQGGEILKWNSTMASYTGIAGDIANGSLISDLPDPWHPAITDFLAAAENSADNLRLELDGHTRWFSLQKSAATSSDDDLMLLVEDKTNAVLLAHNTINNERLASVGRLAAGVAHEIGNPVTGIACIAQNLQHESDAGEIENSLDLILSQTDRINVIVQSLINFSRGDKAYHNELQPVSVRAAAEEAIQLLSLTKPQSREQFVCQLQDDIKISSDRRQLVQVFINLLSNARDASSDDSPIEISCQRQGEQLKIMISDQGSGLPDTVEGRLFEPFVTSKEPGEGTGLGLWVVFNLVKNLGGEITLSSPAINSDRGTTAALLFSLHRE
jgi:signal transduction histidine kinase